MPEVRPGSYRSIGQHVPDVRLVTRACIEEAALDHRDISDLRRERIHVFVSISEMDDRRLWRNDFDRDSKQFSVKGASRDHSAEAAASSFAAGTISLRGVRNVHLRYRLSLFRIVRFRDLHEFLE